jgi:pimeloyl-ACP methyl ester carboxylesterase
VWVHGAGEASRLGWGGQLLPGLVIAGVVVLSYDKRGVGESEGECCPGDTGHFNLLTADAVGAAQALRTLPEIDPVRVGLIGASQAGWIVPRAAVLQQEFRVKIASDRLMQQTHPDQPLRNVRQQDHADTDRRQDQRRRRHRVHVPAGSRSPAAACA